MKWSIMARHSHTTTHAAKPFFFLSVLVHVDLHFALTFGGGCCNTLVGKGNLKTPQTRDNGCLVVCTSKGI